MIWSRRGAVSLFAGGIATLACRPSFAQPTREDGALHVALDALGSSPDPVEGARMLAGFDPRRLSPCARLDLVTVRAGLAAEAQLSKTVPGTAERYAAQVERIYGPVDLPLAAHLLADETKRLESQAAAVFDMLGLPPGTTGTRFRALLERGDGSYADTDAGRDAAVADMNAELDRARTELPRWFAPLPAECLNVSTRRMTAPEMASVKSGFRVLPGAGKPGLYVVDLRDIARRPRWTLASVVHHELLPGHMVQLPIEQAARPHPLRLHYASTFAESWAIHGEWLAWQAGLLPDTLAVAGAIHWRLFRMTRASADLALNGGKSTDRVLVDLLNRLGFPAYFASFADDIERMRATPGVRLAEALGALALVRQSARRRDIRSFHSALLSCGSRRGG